MKFVGGQVHMRTWGIGKGVEAAEEAINNTMAECPHFALLQLDQDASLTLFLAFQDEGNGIEDDEPEFKESLDDVFAWALEMSESKSAFDALMDKVQAAIDRVRKKSETGEWAK